MSRSILPLSILFAMCISARDADAQLIFLEEFDGGQSTTGFEVDELNVTDCRWEFAPDSVGPNDFSVDGTGDWPAGPGFDSSFVFLDSDACGGTDVIVDSYLSSPEFDASTAGFKVLSFSHQFRFLTDSYVRIEGFNGTDWTEVYFNDSASIGYPNPATVTVLDISTAVGTASNARIRFQFNAGWDWWWAIDSIRLENVTCVFPLGLLVSGITVSGAEVSWTDNGSPGYEWVITDGALPDGSNAIASGTGANTTATGLAAGTGYTVFVRAICDGLPSGWSTGVPFTTLITNDGCETAATAPVNEDLLCGLTAAGTVTGATASGVTTTCSGTPDDDVWFTFTAIAPAHLIGLSDITGSTTDLYMAVWTGPCTAPTLVPYSCSDDETLDLAGLTPGEVYYLQVYTWTATPDQTSVFTVCIGTSGIGLGEQVATSRLLPYPDPATDLLYMKGVPTGASFLSIVDQVGRELLRERIGPSLDVRHLVPGAYTLIVQDREGGALARARFIKE